jgi:WD40 repeat protein/HEAT repeat protein
MTISLTCVCGQQYPVREEFSGQRVQCPVCGQVLTVPEMHLPPVPPPSAYHSPLTTQQTLDDDYAIPEDPYPPNPREHAPPASIPSRREIDGNAPRPRPVSILPLVVAVLLILGLMGGGVGVVLYLQPGAQPAGENQQVAEGPGNKTEEQPPKTEGSGEKKPVQDNRETPKKEPVRPPERPGPDDRKPPPPPPDPPPGKHPPFVGHTSPVFQVAFSRDGRRALSGAGGVSQELGQAVLALDNSLRIWDAATGQTQKIWRDFPGGISAVAFSPDGRQALFAAAGKFQPRAQPPGGARQPDVFMPGADLNLHLWDLETGKEVRGLEGHRAEIICIAFSPDGKRAISGGRDRVVRVWEVATGREVQRLVGHTNTVNGVAISPDGRFALSAGSDQTVRYWELQRGTEIRQLPGHQDIVWAVAFSPDGKRGLSAGGFQAAPSGTGLVPGNKDFAIRLWDLETGKELHKLEGHTEAVSAAVFSPDGRRILSGAADRTVRLWQVDTGRAIRSFTGHTKLVLSVAFAPDGTRALSGGEDGVRAWTLPPDIPDLVKALKSGRGAEQARAAEQLGLFGPAAQSAIPDLIGLLKDADDKLRENALAALGKIGPALPEHVPLLIPLLKETVRPEARRYALETLTALGAAARAAGPALGEALKDREAPVRARAAAALGAIGPEVRETASPLLVDALRDADPAVVEAAQNALGRLGPPAKTEVPVLTRLLTDRASTVRRHALSTLGELKGEAGAAAGTVAGMITGDESAELRAQAVAVLLAIRPDAEEALGAFTKALEDRDLTVERAAAGGLAQIGTAGGALPALLRAANHPDALVAKTADAALQKGTFTRAHVRLLGDALPGARASLRARLLEILAGLKGDAADAALAIGGLVKGADEKERVQILTTLRAIGPKAQAAGPSLVPLLERDPKQKDSILPLETALTLIELETELDRALPVLVSALRIEDQEQASMDRRERVAKALIQIGKPAVEHLAKALRTEFYIRVPRMPEFTIRAEARLAVVQILSAMGPRKAGISDAIVALTKMQENDPVPGLRRLAAQVRLQLLKTEEPEKKPDG